MKQLFLFIGIVLLLSGCSGCSHSGRRENHIQSSAPVYELRINNRQKETVENGNRRIIVKMQRIDGVYQVPVYVNGVRMYFIFDADAEMVSISEMEVLFLYKQGVLSKEDIIGNASLKDANGDISDGTIINLRTLKIGRRTLKNVRAYVVHNLSAPLSLGQNALAGFGKIAIDNIKGEIAFE